MLDPYNAAIERHRAHRREAYAAARTAAIATGLADARLRLAEIDRSTLDAWRTTWSGAHHSGAGGWDWPALIERAPRRAAILPIAVWHGDDLCGLALGHASRPGAGEIRQTVTLTHIERRPEPPLVPLRGSVVPISILVAERYGFLLGSRRLRLQNPDRKLLWYYERLRFVVVWNAKRPVYCEREINR